jgi:2-keto-3-deoxy-L-rhamnonate aldolase RhmA
MTSLRERLSAGEGLVGTFCNIPAATAIEIMGRAMGGGHDGSCQLTKAREG